MKVVKDNKVVTCPFCTTIWDVTEEINHNSTSVFLEGETVCILECPRCKNSFRVYYYYSLYWNAKPLEEE